MMTNEQFDIVSEVEAEIDRVRALAEGRYRDARDLAREGDFARAEEMLQDLAIHLPETSDGARAGEHLTFDFYNGKAQALMVLERWEEAGEVARPLLDLDLTPAQETQIQTMLDAVSNVVTAYSMATRTQAMVDTRLVVMFLELTYQEEGQYPRSLALSDIAEWDPIGSRSMLRRLSAIEDYTYTDSSYAFTTVSAAEQHRIRVVDGVAER